MTKYRVSGRRRVKTSEGVPLVMIGVHKVDAKSKAIGDLLEIRWVDPQVAERYTPGSVFEGVLTPIGNREPLLHYLNSAEILEFAAAGTTELNGVPLETALVARTNAEGQALFVQGVLATSISNVVLIPSNTAVLLAAIPKAA